MSEKTFWSNFFNRLTYFQQEGELKVDFALRCGIKKDLLTKWDKLKNPSPDTAKIRTIIHNLNLSVELAYWLTFGDGPPPKSDKNDSSPPSPPPRTKKRGALDSATVIGRLTYALTNSFKELPASVLAEKLGLDAKTGVELIEKIALTDWLSKEDARILKAAHDRVGLSNELRVWIAVGEGEPPPAYTELLPSRGRQVRKKVAD